jgi:predicted metal-dependent enzyme (double-stranded beta helix superfamily)
MEKEIMIKTENALDRFIHDAREWFAKEEDLDQRWEGLRPSLAQLIADPEAIKSSASWPDCGRNETGRGENLIFYEDPDYGFAINGLIKPASSRAPTGGIHDHGHIYTLYGVIDGHETIERYERTDDGTNPDYARIQEASKLRAGPGEIDLVKPYEIHCERNYDERSVAVIIRSQKSGSHLQGRYDLETGKYFQGYGPRQTPAAMFPE